MRNSLTIILGISMLAAAACGGTSKPAKPVVTSTPISDEAFKAVAERAARSVQIVANDLPAGWTGKPHESDDTKLDLSPACAAFNEVDPWKSSVVNINSDDFTDSADREIRSQATAYRTATLAEGDSSFANTVVTRCGGEISDALEAYILKDAPARTADVTFSALGPAELEGWSAGYKLSISATANGEKTYANSGAWLWKVSGRMIAAFEYSGETPIDARMIDTLKALIAKRLDEAAATLPN